MSTLTLRPYQQEAHTAVMQAFSSGKRRVLVTMPTGSGKTVLFGSIIGKVTEAGRRALVLAHREELIDQAAETLRLMLPEASVGIVRAEHDDVDADVIVATVQTLRNPERLQRIGKVSLIVIDEAHHSVADTYCGILDHFGALDDTKAFPKVLGLTATPDRGDRQGLGEIFEEIVYEVSILNLIEQGYLSDVRAKRIILDDLELDNVTRRGGDFTDGALGDAMEDAGAPEHIAEAIRRYAADRKAIAFLPTVELAHQTAAAINAAGIRAAAVDGATPKEERRRIIDQVRAGELQVITNCMVLTEGFDAPVLDCAVMARPTCSRSLYQQSSGRVLRPYFDKPDALILDLVGVTTKHRLQSSASLFGEALEGGEIREGETATEAIQRHQHEVARATGRIIAIDVELFDRSNLNWTTSPRGLMVLTGIRVSYALVSSDNDRCDLYRLDPHGYGFRATMMAEGLSAEMAMGMAEQEVREGGIDPGSHKRMGWRSGPVTDGQRRKLWAMGYRSRKLIASLGTSGAAANLISGIQADEALVAVLDQEGAAA